MKIQATPTKLRSGAWGATVQGTVRVGDTVTVTTRGGKSWDATVARVVWSGDGVSIVATTSSGPPRKRSGPPRPRKRSSGPPEGTRLRRAQGKAPYEVGDVLAVRMSFAEVEACEARQGMAAVDVPPARADGRRVACVVVWADSMSDDEVEDLDAWSHAHSAVVRLATSEEAEPLRAAREMEEERKAALADLDALVAALPTLDALPEWTRGLAPAAKWPAPAMVHTGAYPVVYVGESDAAVVYHVPGYFAADMDYPAIIRGGALTAEMTDAIARARAAGAVR